MKRMIYPALFMSAPYSCFSREKARKPVILKDKTGITRSEEFPDSIKISKIPSSFDAFLKTGMLTDIKVFENIEESSKQYINKTKS